MSAKLKRVLTDAGGYGLILLGIALGWLPGPGGIPLVLGGLGLLSINNQWARTLRVYIVKNSGRAAQILFPAHRGVQAAYDVLTIILLALVTLLCWQHAAVWQISLAIFLFFMALLIASLNRERLASLKSRRKK
jgi:hypothetical protein